MNNVKFYRFQNDYGVGYKKVIYDGLYNHFERRLSKIKEIVSWKPLMATSEKNHNDILKRGWDECTKDEAEKNLY